jgi:hypothetical protein
LTDGEESTKQKERKAISRWSKDFSILWDLSSTIYLIELRLRSTAAYKVAVDFSFKIIL